MKKAAILAAGAALFAVSPSSGAPEDMGRLVKTSFPMGNLIRNGSFEMNDVAWDADGESAVLPAWTTSSLTYAPDANVKPKGGLKFAAYHKSAPVSRALMSDYFPVKPGERYTLSYHYQAYGVQDQVRPVLHTYAVKEDASTETVVVMPVYASHAEWTFVSQTFTMPEGVQVARLAMLDVGPFATSGSGTFYFDDVLLVPGGEDSQASVHRDFDFFNALNRPIQKVTPDGNRDIVTQNFYDENGRLIKKSLPVGDDFAAVNGRHGYLPGITAAEDLSADLLDGYYIGGFKNGTYYPDAKGFSFDRTSYEASALNRPVEYAKPGGDWRPSTGRTSQTSYSSAPDLDGGGVVDPYDPSRPSKYFYKHSKGVDGGEIWEYHDAFGRKVRSGSKQSDGSTVQSDFAYDGLGNLVDAEAPATAGGYRLYTHNGYNTLSLKTSELTPQRGYTEWVYDQKGRLRFSQDESQRTAKKFSFIQYDVLDRILSEGEIDYSAGAGNPFSQANADIPGYPGKFSHATQDGIKYSLRLVNHYDAPPANTTGCQVDEGGPKELIYIVSENGVATDLLFADLASAHAKAKSEAGVLNAATGKTVRIYQIHDGQHAEFGPAPGTEFDAILFNDGVTAAGMEIDFLRKGSPEYFRVLEVAADGPPAWSNLKGRLVKTFAFNPDLAAGPAGEQEVSTVFNYDAEGNVTERYEYNGYVPEAEARCVLTKRRYDARNKTIAKTLCESGDCSGSVVSERYEYDALERLSRVTDDLGNVILENKYDAIGNLSQTSRGGALASTASGVLKHANFYHLHGHLERKKVTEAATGNPIFQEDLRYDGPKTQAQLASWGEASAADEPSFQPSQARFDGKITRASYTLDPSLASQLSTGSFYGFNYAYDRLDRLREANGFGAAMAPKPAISSTYDFLDDGRISRMGRGNGFGNYMYDDALPGGTGRLLGVNGPLVPNRNMVNAFSYYGDGNLKNDLTKNDTQGNFANYRDDEMPHEFDYKEGSQRVKLYMAYNSGRERIAKIKYKNGVFQEAQYYFPGSLELRRSASGGNDALYDLAGNGRIYFDADLGNYRKEFYVRDYMGSTMLAYDHTGARIANAATYFPYGKTIDDLNLEASGQSLTHKYTGKEKDAGIGLYAFGARWLDADIATWISPDKAREFFGAYSYHTNPVGFYDPSGNCSAPAGLAQGQVGFCYEAFIGGKEFANIGIFGVGIKGLGDNRTFQSNDPKATARARLWLTYDVKTHSMKKMDDIPAVSEASFPTKALVGRDTEIGFRGSLNTAKALELVTSDGSSFYKVEASAKNGWSHNWIPILPPWANVHINAELRLNVSADGKSGKVWAWIDGYPSHAMYKYTVDDNGKVHVEKLFEFSETKSIKLLPPLDEWIMKEWDAETAAKQAMEAATAGKVDEDGKDEEEGKKKKDGK